MVIFDAAVVRTVDCETYWREKELLVNPAPVTPLITTVTEPVAEKKDGGIGSEHSTQLYNAADVIAVVS